MPQPKRRPAAEWIKVSAKGKRMSNKATSHVAFVHVPSRLMFAAKDLGRASFEDAQTKASECRLLGHKDWACPDDMQVQLIVDRSRPYPCVRTDLYTGEIGWAWTSRPHASHSGYAWGVGLGGGYVYYYHRSSDGLVLACRRVPPSQFSALGL